MFKFEPFSWILWCGPIWCLHYIIPAVQVKHTFFSFPKCFFPMYPIVDTGFVNYDFFPFFSFLEYSSNAIAEMDDFLFLKCNHGCLNDRILVL